MRIAQCIEVPLFDHGGVEVLVREIIRGTGMAGYETYLVAPRKLTPGERSLLPSIKEVFVWNWEGIPENECCRLVEWMIHHRIQIAHFHHGGTYGWYSRRWRRCPIPRVSKAGIPCVTTSHGAFSIFDCVAKPRPFWLKALALLRFWPAKLHQLGYVAWEAAVSMHDYHALRRWFFPLRSKFIQLYHSKLRGDEFVSPSPVADPRIPKNSYILCLGTVGRRKGQQYLVDSFLMTAEKRPDWMLVIAGRQAHAPTMEAIRALMQSSAHGSRVLLMPDVDDYLACALLEHAAIFAIPSTGEGLGLTLQEAMYAGCACIGSNVGGIPDLIEEGKTGLLVPPADPAALARGLSTLMDQDELRKKLGEAARHSMRERNMSAQNMVDSYLGLYQKALDKEK